MRAWRPLVDSRNEFTFPETNSLQFSRITWGQSFDQERRGGKELKDVRNVGTEQAPVFVENPSLHALLDPLQDDLFQAGVAAPGDPVGLEDRRADDLELARTSFSVRKTALPASSRVGHGRSSNSLRTVT